MQCLLILSYQKMEFSAYKSKVFVIFFIIAFQSIDNILAQIELNGGPLFSGATSFTLKTITATFFKPTPCFLKSGDVSECRRKRGIEERPQIIQFDDSEIVPSAVVGVEATPAPRSMRPLYNAERIFSSFDDNYYNSLNIFRQLSAKGRNNIITVGDCGHSTVNFSQFLSCLGLTVQETTTLTATFTETMTISTGFTTMTIGGCTPAGFPYVACPALEVLNSDDQTIDTTESIMVAILPIEPSTPQTTNGTAVARTANTKSTGSAKLLKLLGRSD